MLVGVPGIADTFRAGIQVVFWHVFGGKCIAVAAESQHLYGIGSVFQRQTVDWQLQFLGVELVVGSQLPDSLRGWSYQFQGSWLWRIFCLIAQCLLGEDSSGQLDTCFREGVVWQQTGIGHKLHNNLLVDHIFLGSQASVLI